MVNGNSFERVGCNGSNKREDRHMATEHEVQLVIEANKHYASRFDYIERLIRIRRQTDLYHHYEWGEAVDNMLQEMPLSVQLEAIYPQREEMVWSILLGTGGPADRVMVVCDYGGDIQSASYQYQDWFTLWTDADSQDEMLVADFARVFYFEPISEWIAREWG